MSSDEKGKPIPTRFEPDEEEMILQLKRQTGLSKSEIVRRSVRLLRDQIEETGDASVLLNLPARETTKAPPATKRKKP